MGVQLSLWSGSYHNQTQRWLRWWDSEGNLLLTGLAAYWRSGSDLSLGGGCIF